MLHTDDIADKIVHQLGTAIEEHGAASLVVCGGSSPVDIFHQLAEGQHKGTLDWSCVTITLVDDRQVPADDPHSNQRLLREHLLGRAVAAARFIPLTDGEDVSKISRPFDVMLLGMGPDGHFASLFPSMVGNAELMATAQPALLETGPEGSPKLPRISMNLAMILQSHLIILLVKGAEKQAVLKAAKTDQGLPVHALLAQTITPVHIATDQTGK